MLPRTPASLALLALAGCTAPEPMTAAVDGCAEVRPPRVCALPATGATITAWVPAEAVTVEGATVEQRDAIDGGLRLRLRVSGESEAVQIDAPGEPARRATIAIGRAPSCPAVEAARALRRSEPAEAGARLVEVAGACKPAARSLAARLALDAGDFDRGLALLAESRSEAATRDRRRWFEDGIAALYTTTWRRPDDAVARPIAAALIGAEDPIGGRARAAYHAAQHALEAGDLRRAARLFDDAIARTRRLGLDAMHDASIAGRARLRATTGRFAAADADLVSLTTVDDACRAARAWTNLGWHRLRAHGRGAEIEAPRPALTRALAEAQRCGERAEVGNARVNLALDAWQRGDGAAMDRHLEAAAAEPLAGYVADQHALFTARRAIETGDLDGAAAALARIDPAPFSEMAWLHRIARGRLAAARGEAEAAEAHWRAADGLAGRALALVPVHGDRGGFLGERDRAAGHLVDSLAGRGAVEDARRVARHAIARLGRALRPADPDAHRRQIAEHRRLRQAIEQQRQAMEGLAADALPAARARLQATVEAARVALDAAYARIGSTDALPPPPPIGTLELVVHPGADAGWWLLATHAGGTTAERFDGTPGGLTRLWSGPLAARLRAARRVELQVAGRLAGVDLHALPLDGRPLAAAVPVAWRFDVGGGAPGSGEGALVVRDPRGDLPAARGLSMPGARVLHQGAATRDAVLAALPTAATLVYGGHGQHDGWSSALALAGGTTLTVADIATLPRAPARVLLAGCETAVGARDGRLEVGLAHGFLLAGSRVVIGATRTVPDAAAEAITTRVLAAGGPSVEALQTAQAALWREQPAGDWGAFRAWVR